jgi:hypothetical protein
VPLVSGVKFAEVVVGLSLAVAITEDDVLREWVFGNRGNNLEIELVPSTCVEVWAVPVREEARNSSLLVGCLHACDEFTVGEFLRSSNGT